MNKNYIYLGIMLLLVIFIGIIGLVGMNYFKDKSIFITIALLITTMVIMFLGLRRCFNVIPYLEENSK